MTLNAKQNKKNPDFPCLWSVPVTIKACHLRQHNIANTNISWGQGQKRFVFNGSCVFLVELLSVACWRRQIPALPFKTVSPCLRFPPALLGSVCSCRQLPVRLFTLALPVWVPDILFFSAVDTNFWAFLLEKGILFSRVGMTHLAWVKEEKNRKEMRVDVWPCGLKSVLEGIFRCKFWHAGALKATGDVLLNHLWVWRIDRRKKSARGFALCDKGDPVLRFALNHSPLCLCVFYCIQANEALKFPSFGSEQHFPETQPGKCVSAWQPGCGKTKGQRVQGILRHRTF